jgi:hypothetical protein
VLLVADDATSFTVIAATSFTVIAAAARDAARGVDVRTRPVEGLHPVLTTASGWKENVPASSERFCSVIDITPASASIPPK